MEPAKDPVRLFWGTNFVVPFLGWRMLIPFLLHEFVVSKKKTKFAIYAKCKIFRLIQFSDCTAPFQVQFVSNAIAAEAASINPQRGFCLEYKQLAC